MILEAESKPSRRAVQQRESRLQAECFTWAWNERPVTRRLLFHVPNENDSTGSNARKGAQRRSMGVVAGVADLLLMIPRGRYHGLCIEMKTDVGAQRPEQKTWQVLVEAQGYKYVIVRSKDDFMRIIDSYLSEK